MCNYYKVRSNSSSENDPSDLKLRSYKQLLPSYEAPDSFCVHVGTLPSRGKESSKQLLSRTKLNTQVHCCIRNLENLRLFHHRIARTHSFISQIYESRVVDNIGVGAFCMRVFVCECVLKRTILPIHITLCLTANPSISAVIRAHLHRTGSNASFKGTRSRSPRRAVVEDVCAEAKFKRVASNRHSPERTSSDASPELTCFNPNSPPGEKRRRRLSEKSIEGAREGTWRGGDGSVTQDVLDDGGGASSENVQEKITKWRGLHKSFVTCNPHEVGR